MMLVGFFYEWPVYRQISAAFVLLVCGASLTFFAVFKERLLKKVSLLALIQIILFLGVVYFIAFNSGSFHNSILIWLAMAPVTMSYFSRPLGVFIVTVLSCTILIISAQFLYDITPPHHSEMFLFDIFSVVAYSFLISLVFQNSRDHIDNIIKSREEDVQRKQRKLAQTAKFNALGKMAANLAHEINNPLFSIQGEIYAFRRSLENEEFDQKKGLDFVDTLDKKILNMSKIIRAVSSFAREGSTLERQEEKLDRIFEEALSFCLDRLKNEEVRFHYHFDPGLYVECNSTQITQVFHNLLRNALDALSKVEERELVVKGKRLGEVVEVTVCDTGEGVEKGGEKDIFEPFFTTKGKESGTGLGLSISRAFLNEHGGSLFLDERDEKTCFVMTLPLVQKSIDEEV